MTEKETKEKVGKCYGRGDSFFLFIHLHSPCISPISFLLSRKECSLPFAAKGRPIQMGEMKEGNLLFSFYSIFKFLPCISPISFFVFLRMKGMNLPFAAIRPIQIGEMEEMEEIGESRYKGEAGGDKGEGRCYGGP